MNDSADSPHAYRGIPVLAGVCSLEEAAGPGLSVEACVDRLKRFHYALKRLHGILTARLTAEPIYELKTAFSHHSYLCAEHVAALRGRVGEMREPPLHLDKVPHPALEVLFDEILGAPTTEELLLGVYEIGLPEVRAGMSEYVRATHPMTDRPSVRVLRFALLEIDDMLAFGGEAVAGIVDSEARTRAKPWLDRLSACLEAAGGLDGTSDTADSSPERMHSATPYEFDPVPARDERFSDPYNGGVNAEAFIYSDDYPAKAKMLLLLFKRLREIDVPEMMASIIHRTTGKDWDYYLAMSRQLWDEARHAMLGEVGFAALGVDWRRARVNHTWSLNLNTVCNPLESHSVLYYIEQGLMTKTGKRYEWELATESGLPLMATIQDFDWADEVLHAQIGRQFLVPEFANRKEAVEFGDRTWSRILNRWEEYREKGLTAHENWWPEFYRHACEQWGEEPDPAVLAFSENYSEQRADLKSVTGSG